MRTIVVLGWLSAAVVMVVPSQARAQSCVGKCGGNSNYQCWCDDACFTYGDCCSDARSACYVPRINGITPSRAPTTGAQLTLTGSNFGSQAAPVSVGTLTCAPQSWSNTQLVCTLPAGVSAPIPVRVTNQWGLTGTSVDGGFGFAAPRIDAVTPSRLHTAGGELVTLSGLNFGARDAGVRIGSSAAVVISQSHTQLVVQSPAGEGLSQPIEVTAGNQTASSQVGRRAPLITSVTPTPLSAAGGTPITVTGEDFGLTPTVSINSLDCAPSSVSHTQIICTQPALSAGSAQVQVTSGAQLSPIFNAAGPMAALQSISPTTGPTAGGISLTLNGSAFGASTVTVGGITCPVTSSSMTQLVCTLPPGEGQAQVVVTTGGMGSNPQSFTYAKPTLSSLMPSTGPTTGGTPITLTGSDFGASATVTFGTAPCPVTSRSATQLVCAHPSGIGTVGVTVRNGAQSSNELPFTYAPATLMSLAPVAPATVGGTPLTLTGSNFGIAGATVLVDGDACPVQTQTHTQIVCTLPAGRGGTVQVELRTPASQVPATLPLTWAAANVQSLAPNHGPAGGGTALTISGANFGATGPNVLIGGSPCPLVSGTHTTAICRTPAGRGVVGVQLQPGNVDGGVFTYEPPTVLSVSPLTGSTAGGYPLTVTGTSFGADAVVRVGAAIAPLTQRHDTLLVATMPAGPGGMVNVSAQAGAEVSNQVAFTYAPPSLSMLVPQGGSTAGGASLTISGDSFGTAPTVTIDGQSAPISSATHTSVVVTVPEGAGGTVPLVLSRAGEMVSGLYSYGAPTLSTVSPALLPTAGGATLTLTGTNFGRAGTNRTVTIGAAMCTSPAGGHTQVTCTTPVGQGTGLEVAVLVAGATARLPIAYAPPLLQQLTPTSLPSTGGAITLTGSNFGVTPTVTVGAQVCTVRSSTHGMVVCDVGAAQGEQPVTLTVGGQSSNALTLTFPGVDAGIVDAGADAGAMSDAGSDGGSETDAGALTDAGTTPVDAGTAPADAGTAPTDAGATPTDAGTAPTDAGTSPTDAGTPTADAGTMTPDDPTGCGCTSGGELASMLAGLALVLRRRRR